MQAQDLLRFREPERAKDLQDAAQRCKVLERKIDGALDAKRRLSVDEVLWRVQQGKLLSDLLSMAEYGDGVAQELASKAGVHVQTLRDALAAYERAGSMREFRAQMGQWEEMDRRVTWTMVRRWGRKSLPDDKEKAQAKVRRQLSSVERRLTSVTRDMADLADQLDEMDEDERAEVRGVITKGVEMVKDLRDEKERTASMSLVQKTARDDLYLDYIRSETCAVCDRPDPDAHHVETGGVGMKGSDYMTVPLCRSCHGELHQHGEEAVFGDYNVYKLIAQYVINYFTS